MAHLLVIELPGGNDADLLQAAIERGDRFSFLSADLGLYRRDVAVAAWLDRAVEQLEVPGFGLPEVVQQVKALHRRHRLDAVLCLIDIRLVEAAELARCLDLPHIAPATARLLRDKHAVRCRLREAGLDQPPFELATSAADLHRAVDRIGLPVLIKPADGYGSQNIVALTRSEDLDPWLNPLDELLPCRADYGLGVRSNDRLVVERLMQGPVVGCDTFTIGGRHHLLGVNAKCFFDAPSFAIRGGCFAPPDAEGEDETLRRAVFDTLDALGFDCGATHSEWVLTDEGPRLIEVNPRLVGAKIPRLLNLSLGRSVHADLIDLHLGRWSPPARAGAALPAATRWFAAPRAGTLRSIALPPRSNPSIRSVELLKRPGDAVRPPMENADRLGCVMAVAGTRQAAEAAAEDYVARTIVDVAD